MPDPQSPLTREDLLQLPLQSGAHDARDEGVCAQEAINWYLGREHSDERPECVDCPIHKFVVAYNDKVDDEARNTHLRPVLLEQLQTADERSHERGLIALDWIVRVYTPAWLALVPSLADHAQALRDLPPITDETASQAGERVRAARAAAWAAAGDAAWAAAGAAAGDAAWDAAWAAAGAAAGDAAGDAAWAAARDAAWAAAWATARAAARDAAGAAAWATLQPTVRELQRSAIEDCYLPMCRLGREGDHA